MWKVCFFLSSKQCHACANLRFTYFAKQSIYRFFDNFYLFNVRGHLQQPMKMGLYFSLYKRIVLLGQPLNEVAGHVAGQKKD